MRFQVIRKTLFAGTALGLAAPGGIALAQSEANANSDVEQAVRTLDSVTVTARRRDESSQDIPVVVSAYGKEQLEALNSNSLEDIAELIPGLTVDAGGGAEGSITLRGVTTGGLNSSSDQAISVNIDGVQLSKVSALRTGQYDLDQLEVLKGPQALFFGKNSPGGILSVKTSDPTAALMTQVRAGYEFEAEEKFGELTVSGPLGDTLGGRLFLRASDQSGPYDNLAPGVADANARQFSEIFGRATLRWEPSARFEARFKLAYGETSGGAVGTEQRFGCAAGTGFSGPLEDCEFDRDIIKGDPNPALANLSPLFRSEPEGDSSLLLTSLEMNWQITDALTLTSLTGLYDVEDFNYQNVLPTLQPLFVAGSQEEESSFSQEVRLTSDFDGPVNFMLGGFVDDRSFEENTALLLPAPTPPFPAGASLLFENEHIIDAESYSAFGQVSWDITDTVELSGGLRYTDETKKLSGTGSLSPTGFALILPGSTTAPVVPTGPFLPNPDEVSYDDLSPEVSLAWKPSDDLLIFAAYKEGFKSGGFNSSVNGAATLATVPADRSFREETVEGFEVGLKSDPLPGVRINVAGYRYEYDDIQLSTFDLSGGGLSTRVVNTGKARTQGIEFDGMWLPQSADGLTLTASLAYNGSAYLEDLFFQCNGQQIAGQLAGCDFQISPAGATQVAPGTGNAQNLLDRPLLRAPEWSGAFGASYDAELSNGLNLRLNGSAVYSGSYDTNVRYDTRGQQDSFWRLNAGISLSPTSERWSLELIGRNLTDEIYKIGTGGVVPLGGTIPGVSPGELQGPTGQPRSVLLQLTYRPATNN